MFIYSAPNKQNEFRICLKQSCNYLRSLPKEMFDPACHVLGVILDQNFRDHFACTIKDVIVEASVSNHPLPIQAERLCDLAEALSARTKVLFLRNYDEPERSWIVLDICALLQDINGKIFAPKGFTENVFKPTINGILTWSQLSKEFPKLDPSLIVNFLGRLEFCQVISDSEVLDHMKGKVRLMGQSSTGSDSEDDVVTDSPTPKSEKKSPIGFRAELQKQESTAYKDGLEKGWTTESKPGSLSGRLHSATCGNDSHHPHSSPSFTRSLSNPHQPCLIPNRYAESCPSLGPSMYSPIKHSYPSLPIKEKYLFFPGLISPEQPREDMWTNASFEYYSGWCLRCVNDQQFFSLRFLHTLLLRLSFSFAITKSSTGVHKQAECTLWKNGLRWLNLDGIETIVEVVEDRKAVLLLTRMKNDSIIKGLSLRAAIIKKILDTKKEYCMRIVTSESFIDPSHLKARHGYPVINQPVDKLRRYDINLIAEAFCDTSKLNRLFLVEEL